MLDREPAVASKREQYLAAIKLATVPLAKALIAIAYYCDSDDPEVARAVWDA